MFEATPLQQAPVPSPPAVWREDVKKYQRAADPSQLSHSTSKSRHTASKDYTDAFGQINLLASGRKTDNKDLSSMCEQIPCLFQILWVCIVVVMRQKTGVSWVTHTTLK